jgi:hypothetical protein
LQLTSSPSIEDSRRLDRAADMAGVTRRILVSQTRDVADDGRRASMDLPTFLASLAS